MQTRMLLNGNLINPQYFDELQKTIQSWRWVENLESIDRILWDPFWDGACPGMTDVMVA